MKYNLEAREGICFFFLSVALILLPDSEADEDRVKPTLLPQSQQTVVRQFCAECHSGDSPEGNLNLSLIMQEPIEKQADVWETVVRRLNARHMPPVDSERPTPLQYESLVQSLVSQLDQRPPDPGAPNNLRRLNRTEYQNVIRDLLGLEIDAKTLLPADELSHGFDNITVGELTPVLLNRYVSAARKVAGLVTGNPDGPTGVTYRPPADQSQEDHVPGLPLGTRGGILISHHFPKDGMYEFQVHLTRDRNEKIEGLYGDHTLEILVDREKNASFQLKAGRDHSQADAHLKQRFFVRAGQRQIGVTFVAMPKSLIETKRKPYIARFNYHRHPRQNPAVFQLSITGPFGGEKSPKRAGATRPLFAGPANGESPEAAAHRVLKRLMRLAYRRPITETDLRRPLEFFAVGFEEGGFNTGMESALSSILVSPRFLFRIEQSPATAESGDIYSLSDIALASRLSFFLWSSIPDNELLSVAEAGMLSQPEVLEQQVRRMLKDPRSSSLVTNFASQWLYLRNLDSITPDHRLYPDFDNNLRQSLRTETELFFQSVIQEDRSITDLLQADYTFLNERLAKHYGIANIYGTRFRRVELQPDSHRGGLLRHGSILTVTSYATRTSPVLRGNWVLENILGSPAPPPPDDVPELEDNQIDQSLPIRVRLSQHRADPACAPCHNLMDPIGFALENYDAIGRWRTHEDGIKLDVSGSMPNGQPYFGVKGLETSLMARPELFTSALTEKLMTFGLGRGIEPQDGPAVRRIVRQSADDGYRFSSVILGIVKSVPFRMSKTR